MTTIKRCVIVALSFILQISFSVVIMLYFYEKLFLVKALVSVLSILIILNIIKNSKRITNEIPIILLIAITPVAGTLIYIALGSNMLKSKTLISIYKSEKNSKKYYHINEKTTKELDEKKLDKLKYFNNYLGYPVSKNNQITYYETGEKFYFEYLKELKKAKKFIFIEYFIINQKGIMWNGILNILKEKVKEGLDVRVMYDDMGSVFLLPKTYKK